MRNPSPVVLLIDDDVNDLYFLESAFRAVGVTTPIHCVHGGEEAVVYLTGQGSYADREAHPFPDFIVTDLKMPGMDGFAVLDHLRKYPATALTPIIVLSGSQDSEDIRRALRLGANSYHVKPVASAALRDLVKALHEHWMVCELPETKWIGTRSGCDTTDIQPRSPILQTALPPHQDGL